jgi:hypothetical protein
LEGNLTWQSHRVFTKNDMKILLKWKKVKPTWQQKKQSHFRLTLMPQSHQSGRDGLNQNSKSLMLFCMKMWPFQNYSWHCNKKNGKNTTTNKKLANLSTPTRVLLKRKLDEYQGNNAHVDVMVYLLESQ